ncbi:peptidoglycan DD-metalloendopeptidase family protein [Dyadobacter chenwenxiniae]|uniref:Peptidoglycan DD-metalloendopeptidase family protein n=1 Tax=Dyadobacter chenwenxiniae TaxID=2906456 RepID=A0A9X1TLC8_9BACT|nr:peptidoglycan DD-metalloendopeptidase family protein [Dyadobacter chenwenxiniae]MCF0062098.1 peptidoglycan DD-metalloendopeptidase family protein [Dyadobacter chenwenxiniae]UON81903.1 peptidoglycan DD-metalloendopeptidase family protein [Dyadobacter chenwenxiniae]
MSKLQEILEKHEEFAPIIQSAKPFKKLDFSASNQALTSRDLSETSVFSKFVFDEMLAGNTFAGIGGYGENRIIYRQRKHFNNEDEQPRSIHLGTDIWAEAGEPIYAPLNAKVHGFAFNNHYGDYGPTIILAHTLDNLTFCTLYGHLSLESLEDLFVGKSIAANEKFATIGCYPENGDWPTHLHFQIIGNIGDYKGDFPGVSSIQDQEHYLNLCPDPNLILRIAENC